MYVAKDVVRSPLYVVTAIINPCRYKSRWQLYRHFAKHVADSGAKLITVEAAFGERDFAVTEPGNPDHVRLRTNFEVWHKENMLNIGISRLPHDWKYVAWVDADLTFARPDWVDETLHQLQHYSIVQMFSEAHDLGPNYEVLERHSSFATCFEEKRIGGLTNLYDKQPDATNPFRRMVVGGVTTWHPGFAWAIRREAFDGVGGLLDFAPLGSADDHMAKSVVGCAEASIHYQMAKDSNYRRKVMAWQELAEKHIQRNVGCVRGLVLHHWHGKKRDRRYWDRWQIILKNKFDPDVDLKRDWQGLWQLTGRSQALRDELRDYFRSRSEDSIDVT